MPGHLTKLLWIKTIGIIYGSVVTFFPLDLISRVNDYINMVIINYVVNIKDWNIMSTSVIPQIQSFKRNLYLPLPYLFKEGEMGIDKASRTPRVGDLVWLDVQKVFLVSPYSFPICNYLLVFRN